MKKFNLEQAKAGKPVCTRDGRKARIICFDRIGGNRSISALIYRGDSEDCFHYNPDGTFRPDNEEHYLDLFMAEEHHVGWINIYKTYDGDRSIIGPYKTEKEAVQAKYRDDVVTTKIEWDE